MKPGLRIAGAMAVGYMLGRKRRLALAALLGAAAATGQLSRARGDVMQRATGTLTDAGLGKLAGPGQQLLDAGKDAVLAALTDRVDSLRGRLDERAEALKAPLDSVSKKKKGARKPEDSGEQDESEEPEDEEPEGEDEESEEPEGEDEDEDENEDEDEGEEDEEEDEDEEDHEPMQEQARRKPAGKSGSRKGGSDERDDRRPQAKSGQRSGSRDKSSAGAPVRRSGR